MTTDVDLSLATPLERWYLTAKGDHSQSFSFFRSDAERKVQARMQEAAARAAVLQPEIDDLCRRLECRFDAVAAQRLADLLLEAHRVTATWTRSRPAAAVRERRHVYSPPITCEEDLSTFVHELGHVLSDERGDRPVVRDGCLLDLLGEVAASERALSLVPFSRRMHRDLAAALRTYLNDASLEAPESVRQRARRFIAGATWRLDVHRREQLAAREDAIADIRRPDPPVLTKRERQIGDIQRWAREAGV